MSGPSVWYFLSDLHLGSDAHDPRGVGEAFPRFLGEVVLADRRPERHLVLLGDTAELDGGHSPSVGGPTAVQQLDDVVAAFPGAFRALARCLRAGVTVHVVAGNHDVALSYEAVRDRLRKHLGAAGLAGLRFHRWVLHVPGLLYAEHGNQHHLLNRFPLVLRTGAGGGDVPPRTPLAAWATQGLPWLRAVRLARALRGARVAQGRAREPSYRELLHREARTVELVGEMLERVDDVTRFRLLPAVLLTFVRALRRSIGLGDHDGYLRRAADRIDNVLSSCEEPPSWYIFGHTHDAALAPLSRSGAYYANCGTWSALGRAKDRGDAHGFPYVLVEHDGQRGSARLRRWQMALTLSA